MRLTRRGRELAAALAIALVALVISPGDAMTAILAVIVLVVVAVLAFTRASVRRRRSR
jgi:hypothetical protein